MLPLVASAYSTNPIQTPLVNTALPGSAVAHVPYDNVAPSVSNAQVENNTKGNSEISSVAASEQPPSENAAPSTATAAGDAVGLGTIAQATFLAQLASQDASPAAQIILVEYEKLVSLSTIKYKPSNAMKPAPEPAGVYGKILQQEKSSASHVVPVEVTPPPPVATPRLTQAPVQEATQNMQSSAPAPQETAAPPAANSNTPLPTTTAAAFQAYAGSLQRNAAIAAPAENVA